MKLIHLLLFPLLLIRTAYGSECAPLWGDCCFYHEDGECGDQTCCDLPECCEGNTCQIIAYLWWRHCAPPP
eukprot:UN09486